MVKFDKIQKNIYLGLLGALVTVVGEMLQGAVVSINTTNKITALFSSFDNLPVWRIGLGSTIGALGILLQFFGVYAIYLTFKNQNYKYAKIYHIGMYVFSIIGAIVHVLMSMMVYAYKISMANMVEVTIWFVLPILVIFFICYIPFSISMAVQFYTKQSIFPKWFFILNPLFWKIAFAIVTGILPNSALTNGISYSNMGLSSVILFSSMLIYLKKHKTYIN